MDSYPNIKVISCGEDNWTEQSGSKAMDEVLRGTTDIQCVFGHNDRLAYGARKVAMAHGLNGIRYCLLMKSQLRYKRKTTDCSTGEWE